MQYLRKDLGLRDLKWSSRVAVGEASHLFSHIKVSGVARQSLAADLSQHSYEVEWMVAEGTLQQLRNAVAKSKLKTKWVTANEFTSQVEYNEN